MWRRNSAVANDIELCVRWRPNLRQTCHRLIDAMSNNPVTTRWADLDGQLFFPRELSWLSFNARVLQEAQNPAVPLIERVRYLGIFSNNLDEFFRVRVAEVRRLISVPKGRSVKVQRICCSRSRRKWYRCKKNLMRSMPR